MAFGRHFVRFLALAKSQARPKSSLGQGSGLALVLVPKPESHGLKPEPKPFLKIRTTSRIRNSGFDRHPFAPSSAVTILHAFFLSCSSCINSNTKLQSAPRWACSRNPKTAYLSPSPCACNSTRQSGAAVRPLSSTFRRLTDIFSVDLLTQTALSPNSTTAQPVTSIANLDATLTNVSQMLDRVLAYVRQVLAGEVQGDKALGRYLMDTLGVAAVGEKAGEDKAFNASLQVRCALVYPLPELMCALQDTLMISYLANLVRAQAEVSARLALVTS
ncbi:hypothetical protein B0H19DRAFT_368355 [Mycena capillaripes]|nr:hypothetical protein B0H19DRAFT_368355 [Mycena capillaripes]